MFDLMCELLTSQPPSDVQVVDLPASLSHRIITNLHVPFNIGNLDKGQRLLHIPGSRFCI